MRFGVREICNVVFRAKTAQKIGNYDFAVGQPVLYIDTAKTSTVEGAATTVYATGGRGNTRLIAWEGEKTLTFTVEDALLSPVSFAMLSGAGLVTETEDVKKVHVHMTTYQLVGTDGKISLKDALGTEDEICEDAPVFIIEADADGSLTGNIVKKATLDEDKKGFTIGEEDKDFKGKSVLVDYYVIKNAAKVSELQIDAANFAGYYYVEADTLFRDQSTGKDMPANITLPNVKIQSNFTFSMASTGDPSTFTFTMDAFPGYTYFDRTTKVLCVIQIVDESISENRKLQPVMRHDDEYYEKDILAKDSIPANDDAGSDVGE